MEYPSEREIPLGVMDVVWDAADWFGGEGIGSGESLGEGQSGYGASALSSEHCADAGVRGEEYQCTESGLHPVFVYLSGVFSVAEIHDAGGRSEWGRDAELYNGSTEYARGGDGGRRGPDE
jgi:hypothetical protein